MMRSLAVAAVLLVSPACALTLRHPTVYHYKIVSGDGGQSVLEGESIRTRGLCVEIILNGRVDTIVCAPKYVTEIPEEKNEPTPAPMPTLEPDPASREARR